MTPAGQWRERQVGGLLPSVARLQSCEKQVWETGMGFHFVSCGQHSEIQDYMGCCFHVSKSTKEAGFPAALFSLVLIYSQRLAFLATLIQDSSLIAL